MLLPRKSKHRKQFRGRRAGVSRGQTTVQFGDYGIKSLEAGWISNRQIEAARIAMTRKIRRGGKVWINLFPDKPYTKKPAETRMTRATVQGLQSLFRPEDVAQLRGKTIAEVLPYRPPAEDEEPAETTTAEAPPAAPAAEASEEEPAEPAAEEVAPEATE